MESGRYLMLENLRRTLDVAYRDVVEHEPEDEVMIERTLRALDEINASLGDVLHMPDIDPGVLQASLVILEARVASVMATFTEDARQTARPMDYLDSTSSSVEP